MKQCTRTAFTQAQAGLKVSKITKNKLHLRDKVVDEPARATYCDQCKAWHVQFQKLVKKENNSVEL